MKTRSPWEKSQYGVWSASKHDKKKVILYISTLYCQTHMVKLLRVPLSCRCCSLSWISCRVWALCQFPFFPRMTSTSCLLRRLLDPNGIWDVSLSRDINALQPNSVRTSKGTQYFTITAINLLTLFMKIISVYAENHKKPTNTKCCVIDS
jgi:hypothetical protein